MLRDDRAAAEAVERWFETNARALPWRDEYDPWEVLVAEVMSQQTRMGVVVDYHTRFLERFPTPAALATADIDEVLTLWSGLGYYTRARNLVRAAEEIVDRFEGLVPDSHQDLLSLPGVGPYTAGAVHSIAFDGRSPIVDGNVARLAARTAMIGHTWGSSPLAKQARNWSADLVEVCRSPRMLNQGLMELGSRICKPSGPECGSCVLAVQCLAFASGETDVYPKPRAKREVERMTIPLLLVRGRDDQVLTIRAEGGELMSGLHHLPHGSPQLMEEVAVESWSEIRRIGSFSHSITRRRIRFDLLEADLGPDHVAEGSGSGFVSVRDLRGLGIPSYVRKALDILDEHERKEAG